MHKIAISLLLLSAVAAGCSDGARQEGSTQEPDTTSATVKKPTGGINYSTSVIVDSSEYVMFPLVGLVREEGEEQDESGYLKKSYRTETYWNIAFYNSATKQQHLLSPDRKMIITSYNAGPLSISPNDEGMAGVRSAAVEKLIFYQAIVDDVNKNGELDLNDPAYLFVSDKAGYNLKQISPANVEAVGWKVISKTGLLLIETRADTNKDGEFDSEDRSVPYLYDLKTGEEAKQVFSDGFNDEIRRAYKKQWPVKK